MPEQNTLRFQIRPGYINLGAGLVLLLLGPVLFFLSDDPGHRLFGAIRAVVSPYLLVKAAWNWFTVLKCYEQGLDYNGRFVAFEELTSFQARVYSMRSHGVTTKVTDFRAEGVNGEGPMSFRMRISEHSRGSPKGEYLIQKASAAIAARLRESLRNTGVAPWGKIATFAADSMLWHKTGQEIAYQDIIAVKVVDAFFRGDLLIRTSDGLRIAIKTTEDNFYPGWNLLRTLIPAEALIAQAEQAAFGSPSRGFFFLMAFLMLFFAASFFAVPLFAPNNNHTDHGLMIIAAICLAIGGVLFWIGWRK